MSLTIGLIADAHYSDAPDTDPGHSQLRGENSLRELQKLFDSCRDAATRPDFFLLLGDTLQTPDHPRLAALLREVKSVIDQAPVPVYYVAGNHDPAPEVLRRFWGDQPGHVDCHGFRTMLFHDTQIPEGYCARREAGELERMREGAAGFQGRLISAQHVPLNPPERPRQSIYRYHNAAEIGDIMRECGYILSLSGHDHRGEEPYRQDGITFLTVPAYSIPPYVATYVTLEESGDIKINP